MCNPFIVAIRSSSRKIILKWVWSFFVVVYLTDLSCLQFINPAYAEINNSLSAKLSLLDGDELTICSSKTKPDTLIYWRILNDTPVKLQLVTLDIFYYRLLIKDTC